MSGEREALVRYRLERAQEALLEAEIMASAAHWNACINRLYYASFYAVTALLLHHDLSASKHTAVRSLFNRQFVRNGVMPAELARRYNDLFDQRQQGDYVDLVRFEEAQVRPQITDVRRFIECVTDLLGREQFGDPGSTSNGQRANTT